MFRIYQGAPGCGKTSLATRLRTIRANDLLIVAVGKNHLASENALDERVRTSFRAASSFGTGLAETALPVIASRFGVESAGDALGEGLPKAP